jgi:uncharacterized protein YecE (DUF72 family)
MRCDAGVLSDFLAVLPGDLRCAFEFRHASWLCEAVYGVLRERNVCLCLAESDKFETPAVFTADFVYCRLRKAGYSEAERAEIWKRIEELLERGKDVFVYFKHEETADGALYAEELLSRRGSTAASIA